MCVCARVCVCARARARACVCVCVCVGGCSRVCGGEKGVVVFIFSSGFVLHFHYKARYTGHNRHPNDKQISSLHFISTVKLMFKCRVDRQRGLPRKFACCAM